MTQLLAYVDGGRFGEPGWPPPTIAGRSGVVVSISSVLKVALKRSRRPKLSRTVIPIQCVLMRMSAVTVQGAVEAVSVAIVCPDRWRGGGSVVITAETRCILSRFSPS